MSSTPKTADIAPDKEPASQAARRPVGAVMPNRRNRVYWRMLAWANRVGLARRLAIGLTLAALVSGVATYVALTGSPPLGPDPDTILVLIIVDLVLLLPLAALVAQRIVKLWTARRKGAAGSRLHARLVLLFSVLAVTPAIIVAVFSALFLSFGVQSWFSERVGTALKESLALTDKYLVELRQDTHRDVNGLAADIDRRALDFMRDPGKLAQFVLSRAEARGMKSVFIFDGKGRILVASPLSIDLQNETREDLQTAMTDLKSGTVRILAKAGASRIRAIAKLKVFFDSDVFLYVSRPIDPAFLGHVASLNNAVTEYIRLEGQRSSVQISFFLLFGMVSVLLLLAAIWLGLFFANRLARPISALITASERVRTGDLQVRVSESAENDEMAILSRSFNRMTSQLERNRRELMEANQQIDARRQFTETVLAGVSAGVIGLDAEGRVHLPNRSASVLLSSNLLDAIGTPLEKVVPEMGPLVKAAAERPHLQHEAELQITRNGFTRTLLVRLAAERVKGSIIGFVVTFDDITELQSAQRKAAWADVARRIAHEIKNPLTPIQLSAERLRRKYRKQIAEDPETFEICTDTIIRQVADIGRLVDEFSSFARMPAPRMRLSNLTEIVRHSLFLQQTAHPGISFSFDAPEAPVTVNCDSQQIGQAVTNLLQNAVDSLTGDRDAPDAKGEGAMLKSAKSAKMAVSVSLTLSDDAAEVAIADNGAGLPMDLIHRLTEPYVTTREKGTGLGLAIVRKIMDDHEGQLRLENREEGGARISLVLPLAAQQKNDDSAAKDRPPASRSSGDRAAQDAAE